MNDIKTLFLNRGAPKYVLPKMSSIQYYPSSMHALSEEAPQSSRTVSTAPSLSIETTNFDDDYNDDDRRGTLSPSDKASDSPSIRDNADSQIEYY